MPTTIEMDWDGQSPAEGRSSGKLSDERARAYMNENFIRMEMVGSKLWEAAGPNVFFVGVFNVEESIHVLRPLNPRTKHDGKFGLETTQVAMDYDSIVKCIKELPAYVQHMILDEWMNDVEKANITHKPTGGASPTSHHQLVARITRHRGEDVFERYKKQSIGYALKKMPKPPHQLFIQSQTLNNDKFLRSLRNDPQTSNVPLSWSRVIHRSLELILPGDA